MNRLEQQNSIEKVFRNGKLICRLLLKLLLSLRFWDPHSSKTLTGNFILFPYSIFHSNIIWPMKERHENRGETAKGKNSLETFLGILGYLRIVAKFSFLFPRKAPRSASTSLKLTARPWEKSICDSNPIKTSFTESCAFIFTNFRSPLHKTNKINFSFSSKFPVIIFVHQTRSKYFNEFSS